MLDVPPFSPRSANLPLAPDGLPLLSGGKHAAPGDGACFMEFASVLAGGPFNDHPRCTHPVLADLARQVNDAVDDVTRQHLLCLVPDVVGLRTPAAPISATVVAVVTEAALLVDAPSPRLRHTHARAVRRRDSQGAAGAWVRLTDAAYRQGAAHRAVTTAVTQVRGHGGGELVQLMRDAITAVRDLQLQPLSELWLRADIQRTTDQGRR